MTHLKVLHIGKYFPPYAGGMENYLRDLIEEGFIDRSAALEASIEKQSVSQLQNLPGGGKLKISTHKGVEPGGKPVLTLTKGRRTQ